MKDVAGMLSGAGIQARDHIQDWAYKIHVVKSESSQNQKQKEAIDGLLAITEG